MSGEGTTFRWVHGSTFEHGAYVTLGLEEMVLDPKKLRIRTKLGSAFEFLRDEVEGVKIEKRRWTFTLWFTVVDAAGEPVAPIAVAVFGEGRLIAALEATGWLVDGAS